MLLHMFRDVTCLGTVRVVGVGPACSLSSRLVYFAMVAGDRRVEGQACLRAVR